MNCEKQIWDYSIRGLIIKIVPKNPLHKIVIKIFEKEFKEFDGVLEILKDPWSICEFCVVFTDLEIYKAVSAVLLFGFIIDDYSGQNADKYGKHWISVLKRRHSDGNQAIDRFCNYWFKTIKSFMTEEEEERHVNAWIEWIEYNIRDERKIYVQGLNEVSDIDYDKYLQFRIRDAACACFLTWLEVITNVDKQAIEANTALKPLYLDFYDKIAKHMAIVNDLYSFKRNIREMNISLIMFT